MKPPEAEARLREIQAQLVHKRPLPDDVTHWLLMALKRWHESGSWYELARPFGIRATRRGTAPARKNLGRARYADKDNNISPDAIGHVAFELENPGTLGDPHPHDVIATLCAIYRELSGGENSSAVHGRILPPRIRLYLRTAIGRYLRGGLTLEQSFGLKRSRRGKAGRSVAEKQQIAGEVLILCLKGARLVDAAASVGAAHGLVQSQVLKDCWRPHRIDAIELAKKKLLAADPNRRLRHYSWNGAEKKALVNLFKRDNKKLIKAGIHLKVR